MHEIFVVQDPILFWKKVEEFWPGIMLLGSMSGIMFISSLKFYSRGWWKKE